MNFKDCFLRESSLSCHILQTEPRLTCCFVLLLQILRSELKEREHLVVSTLDQARMFLADQPIEGPGEPRKNLQPKTGTITLTKRAINIFISGEEIDDRFASAFHHILLWLNV